MKNIFENGKIKLGCNYWARGAGLRMWTDWNEETVDEDVKILSEVGVKIIRIFPLWSDFQPVDTAQAIRGNVGGYTVDGGKTLLGFNDDGVDEVMLGRFRRLLDIAQKYGVQTIPSILTGWMSGGLFVPPILKEENMITSPKALMWSVRFIRRMVNEFKDHAAVAAWCIGNECNCMGKAATREDAWLWSNIMADAIRAADPTRPVIHGMHGIGNPDESVWQLGDGGEACDYLTTHPYACPIFDTDRDTIYSYKPLLHPVSQTLYYRGVGKKPAFIEEIGTYGQMNASNEMAGLYCRGTLFSAWTHDCLGYLWWLGFDQGSLDFFPYSLNNRGSNYGLFKEDGSEKPVGKEIREFSERISSTGYERLPGRIVDAICIVASKGADYVKHHASAFVLAKQAGLDIEYAYACDPIPEAKAYILPSIQHHQTLPINCLRDVMKRVENGATLYVSLGAGYLKNLPEDFGIELVLRHGNVDTRKVTVGEESFEIKPTCHYDVKRNSAKAIGVNDRGEEVFFTAHYGKGTVMLLTYDLEEYLSNKIDVFENKNYYKVYEQIKKSIKSDKIAECNSTRVGITEHIVNDSERIVTASNYASGISECEIRVPKGWKLYKTIYKDAKATEGGAQIKLDIADSVAMVFKKV